MAPAFAKLQRIFWAAGMLGLLCGWGSALALPTTELIWTLESMKAGLTFDPPFATQELTGGQDINPSFPYTSSGDTVVSAGDITNSGARARARSTPYEMAANAHFRAGSIPLASGSAYSWAWLHFHVVNKGGTPRATKFEFFLPPTLLEFTDTNEVAGLQSSPISAHAWATLEGSLVQAQPNSSVDLFDFAFEAALREQYVPGTQTTPPSIDYLLSTSAHATGSPLDVSSLLNPGVVVDDVGLGKTVTADFAPFLGEVDLGVLLPGDRVVFEYHMGAFVYGGGYVNSEAIAAINDPVGVQSMFSLTSWEVGALPEQTIPEPTTSALLLAGWAAFLWLSGRRS